jgi:DNA-binding response OmpR family regulator
MKDDPRRTIVYIEDDPEMISLVSVILRPHGFDVKGAPGGQSGLDLILAEKPDLVLLDLMIPDMDGWEIYHQVRTGSSTASLPVIVITAKSQPVDRVLGLNIAGVDDYICKPFLPQELVDSIHKVLTSASAPQG